MKSDSDDHSRAARLVTVDAGNAGQRIDNFLSAQLKGVPKSRIYRGLRTGEVRVNKGRVRQTYRLEVGDRVRIPPWRVSRPSPRSLPDIKTDQLEHAILHEDQELLVLDKPAGWAVHGGSGRSFGVIEGLRASRPDSRHLELAHRLDKDTSGCLVLSKKRSFLTAFQSALRQGKVDKKYLCLVAGRMRELQGEIDTPLRKRVLRSGERMVDVHAEGKPALTRYKVLDASAMYSLLEVELVTGRTHQIRVHLASQGHAIAGDPKYGDKAFSESCRSLGLRRLFLHAARLQFQLGGDVHRYHARLPHGLVVVLESAGLGSGLAL